MDSTSRSEIGTFDRNGGITKKEYKKLEVQRQEIDTKIKDLETQAKQHKDQALTELIKAFRDSIGAGLAIEVPPLALLEGFFAVEEWKETAREYSAAIEIERKIESEKELLREIEKQTQEYGDRWK